MRAEGSIVTAGGHPGTDYDNPRGQKPGPVRPGGRGGAPVKPHVLERTGKREFPSRFPLDFPLVFRETRRKTGRETGTGKREMAKTRTMVGIVWGSLVVVLPRKSRPRGKRVGNSFPTWGHFSS